MSTNQLANYANYVEFLPLTLQNQRHLRVNPYFR